jgi:hypothetical protein
MISLGQELERDAIVPKKSIIVVSPSNRFNYYLGLGPLSSQRSLLVHRMTFYKVLNRKPTLRHEIVKKCLWDLAFRVFIFIQHTFGTELEHFFGRKVKTGETTDKKQEGENNCCVSRKI